MSNARTRFIAAIVLLFVAVGVSRGTVIKRWPPLWTLAKRGVVAFTEQIAELYLSANQTGLPAATLTVIQHDVVGYDDPAGYADTSSHYVSNAFTGWFLLDLATATGTAGKDAVYVTYKNAITGEGLLQQHGDNDAFPTGNANTWFYNALVYPFNIVTQAVSANVWIQGSTTRTVKADREKCRLGLAYLRPSTGTGLVARIKTGTTETIPTTTWTDLYFEDEVSDVQNLNNTNTGHIALNKEGFWLLCSAMSIKYLKDEDRGVARIQHVTEGGAVTNSLGYFSRWNSESTVSCSSPSIDLVVVTNTSDYVVNQFCHTYSGNRDMLDGQQSVVTALYLGPTNEVEAFKLTMSARELNMTGSTWYTSKFDTVVFNTSGGSLSDNEWTFGSGDQGHWYFYNNFLFTNVDNNNSAQCRTMVTTNGVEYNAAYYVAKSSAVNGTLSSACGTVIPVYTGSDKLHAEYYTSDASGASDILDYDFGSYLIAFKLP